MLDIKFLIDNQELVKENIKKKFQDAKLPLVDEVVELYEKNRNLKQEGDNLRAERNATSQKIGLLMRIKQLEEAEQMKKRVVEINEKLVSIEEDEKNIVGEIKKRMMVIPNIIDASVPIGKDDSENVELKKFGEPVVPSFEVPYHSDILNRFNGLDKDSAGRTSGNGFY